jgi:hypothetical protein
VSGRCSIARESLSELRAVCASGDGNPMSVGESSLALPLLNDSSKEITQMKTIILTLTLTLPLAGLVATGCDNKDSARGCDLSNTTPAPADGLITAFSSPGSAVQAVVPAGPASSAPTFTTDGALRIMADAPVLSTAQTLVIDLPFDGCIDATAFTGVQFSISGYLSGCTFGQASQDSAHLMETGFTTSLGTGAAGAHPNSTVLTADQITTEPQTVTISFAAQANGLPATATDPSKLTDLGFVFHVAPHISGGPTVCKADLTIADVKFY